MDAPPRNGSDRSLDPLELDPWFGELARRAGGEGTLTLRAWLELAEAWRIREALRQCGGNRSAAARALGIGRRTLYTKMGKLGIAPSWSAELAAPGPLQRAEPA